MNHGSWTGLFCPLFFLPCYDTDAVQRAAKVALMTLFRSVQVSIFNHMAKMAQTCLLPDTLGEPDSQRVRAPGPFFFSARSGRSQQVHPGSRVSRVSTRCRAIQNCQNREPRQQRRRHPSPFSAAPVRGQRATMIHLSFELGARVSRLWSPPPPPSPINKSWARSAEHPGHTPLAGESWRAAALAATSDHGL